MIIKDLQSAKLISAPKWMTEATQYLTIMGSVAYGVSTDSSDLDIYGWCIPPRSVVFPHENGFLHGFDRNIPRFDQWQQHHIDFKEKNYDFSIYNIIKYFDLCADCNPNMIDSLFVPQNMIIHATKVAWMVRDNRRSFLSKKAWHTFKGYSYSQLHKSKSKSPDIGSKRKALREKYGMDVKFLYHVVRLILEVEQILMEGDLDLQEKSRREHMKAIRRGEIPEEEVRKWFTSKEKELEKLYINSSLRNSVDREEIKNLLLNCLEHHYGSLDNCFRIIGQEEKALNEIKQVLEKYGV